MHADNLPKNQEKMMISLENVLPSLAKNLYGDDWRISIRELLQNAHDALAERSNWSNREGPQIDVIPDPDAGTLTFADNGIGMNLEEVRKYLATVGYGRKREQIEELKKAENTNRDALKNIIGQYGIGFLSSFIIAERVDVFSRSVTNTTGTGVHAVFTGKTEWHHEEVGVDSPGTRVVVRLIKEPITDPLSGKSTFLRDLLNFQRLRDEVRRFGDLLPFPIYVHRGPNDQSPQLANTTAGPWERPNSQKHQLLEFLKTRHPDENEPLWVEPFQFRRAGAGVEAHGILYFPNPELEFRRSYVSVARVDLFSRRMFITDDIPSLLPEWAKFAAVVVECPDLAPTLNRNDVVRHDPAFVSLKQALSKQISEMLVFLAEKQPKDYLMFLDAHTERLHSAMLESWRNCPDGEEKNSFFGAMIDHIPFNVVDRSRPAGQLMALPRYLKEFGQALKVSAGSLASKMRVYFLGDYSTWGQFRAMILQKDLPVILPSGHGEPALLKAYGQVFSEKVEMTDVRQVLDLYVEKVDQAPYEQMKQYLGGLDGGGPDEVTVSKFSPSYVSAIMTMGTADNEAQAKTLEAFLQQGASVLDPKLRQTLEEALQTSKAGRAYLTLTLNANNQVIQKLSLHCQQRKPLAGIVADVLHEIYHAARSVSDPAAVVSDHYFEHRNNLLAGLVDLNQDYNDIQRRYDTVRLELDALKRSPGRQFGARNCAMLLTDLRGSTRMIGFLDAEKSTQILLEYAARIREIVEKHGGMVEKFTGDGLFAYFWNAETKPDGLVKSASLCAFEIHGATNEFFDDMEVKNTLISAGGLTIRGCRTALHFGEVNYCDLGGVPTLIGRNVVALFRILAREQLFERCPVVMTNAVHFFLNLATQIEPLEKDVKLDPSLTSMTIYPHPNFVVSGQVRT